MRISTIDFNVYRNSNAISKMLILFFTFIIMSSINITSAGETTKQNEVIESNVFTTVIHYIGKLFNGPESEGSRTFFRKKLQKLQLALLPLMFKLGVLATVVKIILVLVLKGVLIGKLILMINLGFIIAKIAAWKSQEHHTGWQQPQWSSGPPLQTQSWYPQQPIHVHIHNDNKEPHLPNYSEHDQPHPPYSNQDNSRPVGYDRLDIGPVSKYTGNYGDPYSSRYRRG